MTSVVLFISIFAGCCVLLVLAGAVLAAAARASIDHYFDAKVEFITKLGDEAAVRFRSASTQGVN